jgi:hypothetical protein
MTKQLTLALVALVMLLPASTNAQQRPQPLNTDATTQTTTTTRLPHGAMRHWPMPAAQYQILIDTVLAGLTKALTKHPTLQGEANKIILLGRDCTSRAMADGYVTRNENRYCISVLRGAFKESAHSPAVVALLPSP